MAAKRDGKGWRGESHFAALQLSACAGDVLYPRRVPTARPKPDGLYSETNPNGILPADEEGYLSSQTSLRQVGPQYQVASIGRRGSIGAQIIGLQPRDFKIVVRVNHVADGDVRVLSGWTVNASGGGISCGVTECLLDYAAMKGVNFIAAKFDCPAHLPLANGGYCLPEDATHPQFHLFEVSLAKGAPRYWDPQYPFWQKPLNNDVAYLVRVPWLEHLDDFTRPEFLNVVAWRLQPLPIFRGQGSAADLMPIVTAFEGSLPMSIIN